ncbi:hypothetical protein DPMN_150028 [Dreissena polymorpha]|uniref:Uncharacterized protein n=1 Tax=Dreissena polymorpha TaxID=45954 RepID=A0A9D4J2Z2_DREPO|nr:hypothetical protein DPMN_150028 [Dreissena polymorpha]
MFTTIFKLVQGIHITNAKNVTSRKTNVLIKFHEDWTKNKTAPPPGGQGNFSPQKGKKPKFVGRFDRLRALFSHIRNTAPPPGGHVFQWTETIFELNQHIIKTNILTKLHEDWASNLTSTVFTSFELGRGIIGTNFLTKFHEIWTINVASRVFTRQMLTTHARTTDKRRSQ